MLLNNSRIINLSSFFEMWIMNQIILNKAITSDLEDLMLENIYFQPGTCFLFELFKEHFLGYLNKVINELNHKENHFKSNMNQVLQEIFID